VAILFLVAVFGLMYFLLIRPQQRRMREQQALVRDTEVGDEVMTSSGIYGIVTELEDDTFLIEVAEGIEVRMARGAVAKILTKGAGAGPSAAPSEKPGQKPAQQPAQKQDEQSDADDAHDNT